jgi:toxin ParE1/3/4
MRRSYLVSLEAQQDLDEIWDYTEEHWGEAQAERYTFDLKASVEALASGKRQGRPCDQIRPGLFKLTCGSHLIFYKQTRTAVTVVRILHQRMDFARHL